MKLTKLDKSRLSLTIIKEMVKLRKNFIEDDILQEFETKTPKSIMEKLTGDIDNPKSEVGEYDKHARKLIRKVFNSFPNHISSQIHGKVSK